MISEDVKIYIRYVCFSHSPAYDYNRDLSCDEMGCGVCNCGKKEYAEMWITEMENPPKDPEAAFYREAYSTDPDESEIAEALDWWNNEGGKEDWEDLT